MAYNLTLHFTAGDRTVSVLKEGYSSGNQVGARGKHATQTCQLSIRSYEVSAMLLQEEAPLIRGELKDDDLVIFQGVVRPYQTVSAKNATENVFSLQLMDDTEILKNASITDTEEYLDKTLAWCVQYLYDMAGIPEQLDMPGELSEIPIPFFNLNPERYPKVSEQLEAMLWEYGYDYKFSGTVCRIIRTWIESAAGIGTVNVRNTLRVQRDDNWSDGVKVNYGIMEICRQIPLASWKEDVSDLQWWRYALPWSYSTSAGRAKRTVAYDPFYGLPASSKPKDFKTEYILSAQNLRTNASRCEIHSVTPHAQSVEIDFSWDVTQNYVWGEPVADWPYITVVGDIIYAVPGDYQENIVGEKPDEYTLVYIRNEEGAKAFAEREYKRAKCAPITFSFQSLENYEAGSFYRLADSVTGINAVIRILSCSMDANGIYTVKAESADYIGMVVEVEELRLRDALDVGASVVLTASTDAVGEGASVTVTASGRLLDIIEVEGDETFSYEWELNDEHVPAWDDEKEITATFSELGDDNNVFKFNVYHSEGGQKILIGTGLVSTLKTVEGKDGDSAEIQYAIGDSFVDPPQSDMLWNDVPMQWDGENMRWAAVEYTDDVPDMQRARYIWMRTRVGDGEWQYTRLTGSTSWDPENLGVATTETPKHSKEGLGLIPGDYFVAGDTFHDPSPSGPEYKKGFAYSYTGSGWTVLDLADPNNSDKALECLSSLVSSGINVTDSTASIWGWFENLVAQNAVLNNLVASLATISELTVTGNIINDVLTTVNATAARVFSSLTSSQSIYSQGHQVIGSRPSILLSDVRTLFGNQTGTIQASSGSITIDGTVYTASGQDPITLVLFDNEVESALVITQSSSNLNITFASRQRIMGSYNYAETGYLYTQSNSDEITANNLSVVSSNGSVKVHDVLAQDSTADKIGSSDIPFNDGYFKNLNIEAEGLKYKLTSRLTAMTATISDTTAKTETISDFTNYSYMILSVSSSSSNYNHPVSTGLLPVGYFLQNQITLDAVVSVTERVAIDFTYTPSTRQLTMKALATPTASLNVRLQYFR